MPAFLTHFWILNQAVGRCRDGVARQALTQAGPLYTAPGGQSHAVSQIAFLGSMGPDWPAYNQDGLRRGRAGTIFDLIHRKKASVVAANLLDAARAMRDPTDADACLAFALGTLAHIAGDIVLHPYVNNFAGEYHHQAMTRCFRAAGVDDVAMHMFCEAHMDSYVASSHYGAGDQMSNGPGDVTTHSWSDFLDDLVHPGFAALNRVPILHRFARHRPRAVLDPLVTVYMKAINRAYPGMHASREQLVIALSVLFDVLDLAYDTAGAHEVIVTPVLDWWNLDFVEHPHYRDTWRRFDDLCEAAADVAARVFWPAAAAYVRSAGSSADRTAFLQAVGRWNLDTGVAIRVVRQGDTVRIRYESSWARFLDAKPLPRSIDRMNAELMRVARDAARVSRRGQAVDEERELTAGEGTEASHAYRHPGVDYGLARVRCLAGRVRVAAYAEIVRRPTLLDRAVLGTGDERVVELRTADHTLAQANRIEVETLAPTARYHIEFVSWDR